MKYGENFDRLNKQVKRFPVLSQAEERSLAARYRDGDTGAGNRIIASHFRYALYVASCHISNDQDLPDAYAVSCIALIGALKQFNPDLGNRYISIAMKFCRRRVLRHIENTSGPVRFSSGDQHRKAVSIVKSPEWVYRDLSQSSEVCDKLARRHGVPADLVIEADAFRKNAATEIPACSKGRTHRHLVVDGDAVIIPEVDRKLFIERVSDGMQTLNEVERQVMTQRYLSPEAKTQREIAEILNRSPQYVQAVETRAIRRIRGYLVRRAISPGSSLTPLMAVD